MTEKIVDWDVNPYIVAHKTIKPHKKPLSVSLRVLPSYNKHTNHKPSRRYWFLPRESHKKFLYSGSVGSAIIAISLK